jgi:preprotein translocase subunit SecG
VVLFTLIYSRPSWGLSASREAFLARVLASCYNGGHLAFSGGGNTLSVYLNIVQIIVSIALIAVILLQGQKGRLGGLLGGDSSLHHTRRGIEKTLHNLTIILAVTFLITSLLNVIV